ncbi:MAG: hypothetical protein VKJ24_01160 [Synechococcales bacterium]|nr:hypothetical protein [Synechococcales bacterium]
MPRKTPAKKPVPPSPVLQTVTFTQTDSDRELWTAVQEELATQAYEDFSDLCKVALEQFLFAAELESKESDADSELADGSLTEVLHQLQDQIQHQIHPPLRRIEQLLATPAPDPLPQLNEHLVLAISPLKASLEQMEQTLDNQASQISEPLIHHLNSLLQHTEQISTQIDQQQHQWQQQFGQLEQVVTEQENTRSQSFDQQLQRLADYLTQLEIQSVAASSPDLDSELTTEGTPDRPEVVSDPARESLSAEEPPEQSLPPSLPNPTLADSVLPETASETPVDEPQISDVILHRLSALLQDF